MVWVATAIVGSAVIGGIASSNAADAQADAAEASSDATIQSNRENIAFQQEVFDQQREDNAPWRDIGQQSLLQLQSGINSGKFDPSTFKFEADPGYQFRLEEGVNALDASAAARGRLQSGAQDKALTRYGQNFASNEYSNAFNRDLATKSQNFNQLASLSNVGQIANSANQQAGANFAQNVGNSTLATGNALANNATAAGNARASAYTGMATAANQGIQNYLTYKMY